jgi:hypothetical protein
MSLWGKTALIAGVFDPRIAVGNPVSTGGGGTPVDRFVSVSVSEADSKIDADWGTYPKPAHGPPYAAHEGFGKGNKTYQYLKLGDTKYGIQAARGVTAAEALIDPTKDLDGGGNNPWSPNSEGHQRFGDPASPYYGPNIKSGYSVHAFGVEFDGVNFRFQAPQGLSDIRWGYAQYWNSRFLQLPILYQNMNLHQRPGRGDWGYMSAMPFDQHYLTILAAPRGLLIQDGFISTNTAPEAEFMSWLATREVYRLLGVEDYCGIGMYIHGHAQPERDIVDLLDFCDAYYRGSPIPAHLVPKTKDAYPFPIDDPRSKFDYLKLDWAAPGYESIASQVKKLVP